MPSQEQPSQKQVKIDWSGAEIDDGVLSAPLEGSLPKGWGKRFAGVLAADRESAGD